MSDAKNAWAAEAKKMFVKVAGEGGLSADSRGLVHKDPNVWGAIVAIQNHQRLRGTVRVTFDLRIWTIWLREFYRSIHSTETDRPFPPSRYWASREESADLTARWTDQYIFKKEAVEKEWFSVDSPGSAERLAEYAGPVIEAMMLPNLLELIEPTNLIATWMSTYDPPNIGLSELRAAAVVAHGIGEVDKRDQALSWMETAADTYEWCQMGHYFAAEVRSWAAAR